MTAKPYESPVFEKLRDEIHQYHLDLVRNHLVILTSGNVSLRSSDPDLVLIKPSGVDYSRLSPASYVVVDLAGNVVEGSLKPSSDTASHLYIYRHRPDVNAVVHTHSTHATAFAATGKAIPVFLTAMADEFGGPIPCTEFAFVGGEDIGREVVRTLGNSPAVLLRQHGVLAVGSSGDGAVRAAILVEEMARVLLLAKQLGEIDSLQGADVDRMRKRFVSNYGQNCPSS
jgi:L-ribulose-5-phosphate 4-epimerase